MNNSNRPTLICTVGLPFSGKDEWAKTQGLPVVALQAIKEGLSKSKKETEALTYTKQLIQSLFLSGNPVVILLAENLTEKDRAFWQDDARWHTQYREFKITELEAMRIAQANNASKATLDQIKTKVKAYEPLSPQST